MSDIYSENILDHYNKPRNFGKLLHPTSTARDSNPLCGDDLEMQLLVDKNGKVVDVRFNGEGCAISVASASMLTEAVKGKDVKFVKGLDSKRLLGMLGISLGPVRLKCALLPLNALKRCAGGDSGAVPALP